jgi:peptide-methionine (R)-S-oxide reductase
MTDRVKLDESTWRERLTDEQYRIVREGGTEPPFTGRYVNEKRAGIYRCVGCGAELFRSGDKYDSGSGWPSFTDPASKEAVATRRDTSHGMIREEVLCGRCDGHLGHVFPDGPGPGGLRYCINSASLDLDPEES